MRPGGIAQQLVRLALLDIGHGDGTLRTRLNVGNPDQVLDRQQLAGQAWQESQGPFDSEQLIENDASARMTAFLSGSKPKMNPLDKKIAEMQDQLALLYRQREATRLERAKSYADAFIRKLEADNIPLAVGLQAFQDLSKFSVMKSTSHT